MQVRCESCGEKVPMYDTIHYGLAEGSFRVLCTRCFNDEVARAEGLPGFPHVTFEPVSIAGCDGSVHEFHFQTRLCPPNVVLDAFEIHDGRRVGYEFQIIGDAEDELLVLLGRLIEKVRRALASKDLVHGSNGTRIGDRGLVRGRIEWDPDSGGALPMLTIDGQPIAWEEFGRMLMTYEGWQFKLTIHDLSEEV